MLHDETARTMKANAAPTDKVSKIVDELRTAFREMLDVSEMGKMDQDCAELREDLAKYGVDLSDPVAGRTVIAMTAVMNSRGLDHYLSECHNLEAAFGMEFIDVSGLASKLVADSWGRA